MSALEDLLRAFGGSVIPEAEESAARIEKAYRDFREAFQLKPEIRAALNEWQAGVLAFNSGLHAMLEEFRTKTPWAKDFLDNPKQFMEDFERPPVVYVPARLPEQRSAPDVEVPEPFEVRGFRRDA